ncbi:palmitoyltransferase ZDHHC1-like [Branchiostoma floridae]|uniref:Palmitoyltransferase n=1 Tax=Branchiostoma floridae TaxID=7739 RepID=A0A9J7MU64_BRAFL|nr:palmitoyltransferase ZDHHC1-like [Branchiostoma floridae]
MCCCKDKDSPDPGSNAALAVQKPRKNGWSWPLHPFQLVAWFFIAYFGVIHFGVLVPVMPAEWQIAGYIIVGIFLALHCILHIWSLTVNPADDNVIRKWKGLEPKKYDRTMQAHVIENNRCYICDTDVCASAKHCRLCNKCVSGFDHHCRWLNSCIGDKNYKLFISCLVSALVGAVLILAISIYVTVMYFVDPSALHYAQQGILVSAVVTPVASDLPSVTPNVLSNDTSILPATTPGQSSSMTYKYYLFAEVPGEAFVSIVILTSLLCVVAMLLLGHLLCFHLYLMCNSLSTYDYIMRGREKAKQSSPESSQQNLKGNKVAPVAMISREQGLHESMENGYVPENGYHHGSYDPNSSDEDTRQMQRQYEEVLMEDEALSPRLTARSSGRHRPKSSERERLDSDIELPKAAKMPRQLPPLRPVANLVQETTQVAPTNSKKKRQCRAKEQSHSDSVASERKKPKRNGTSKEKRMEVAAIAANGTYTPRGYHINPALPPITPPAPPPPMNDVITPARSPSPYHSSSAESLHEIPLDTIRSGYDQLALVRNKPQVIPAGGSPNSSPNFSARDQERRSHPKRRKAKPKERRPRPLDVPPLELTQTVTDGEYSIRSDVTTAQSGRPLPVMHMATSNV